MSTIPFQHINWQQVPKTEHAGATGTAWWQTLQFGDLRIRQVTYSPGYLADHWCEKGHIVHCLAGAFETELADGRRLRLEPGMSYVVSDGASAHRSVSEEGVQLLIIDGAFLQPS